MKINGKVTAYDPTQGRGVVTLENGTKHPFKWDDVHYADPSLRFGRGESRVGDGRSIRIGDHATVDFNDVHQPVCIAAGAQS